MAPNPRFTYTPSVLTNVSVEAKIVYCPFKLSTRSCSSFFIRLILSNDCILSVGPHFIFKDNSGTDMAFKLTDPDLKFFFGFRVKFGNPENSDYFCCFYSVLLLLFEAGFPNRTHLSITNTRHSVSTWCILVH